MRYGGQAVIICCPCGSGTAGETRCRGGARRGWTGALRRRFRPRSHARPRLEGSRPRGVRHPAGALLPLLKSLGRVEPVGQAFPVYKLGAIDVALPRRESKTGRGHKGFTVEGDPSMPFEEAARRRDFTINAIGWDPLTDEYLDPFRGPEGPRPPCPPSRRSGNLCRRLAPCPPCLAVCRAVRPDDRSGNRAHLLGDRTRRSAGRAHLGRVREIALAGRAAVDRFRARARARRDSSAAARDGAALRLPAGSRMASRRQRLDPHADGDRQGEGVERRSRSAAAGHDHARRGLPRSRQAVDHGRDRRPGEVTES